MLQGGGQRALSDHRWSTKFIVRFVKNRNGIRIYLDVFLPLETWEAEQRRAGRGRCPRRVPDVCSGLGREAHWCPGCFRCPAWNPGGGGHSTLHLSLQQLALISETLCDLNEDTEKWRSQSLAPHGAQVDLALPVACEHGRCRFVLLK